MSISSSLDLPTISSNVELFNNISLDSSQTMFKECLGEEFPFEIISAVSTYTNKLSTFLNSSLDDLLCGSAVSDVVSATKDLGETLSDSDVYAVDPIFATEAEKETYMENGAVETKTITSSNFLTKFDKASFVQYDIDDSTTSSYGTTKYKRFFEKVITGLDEADEVNIRVLFSNYERTTDGHYIWSFIMRIEITNLYRSDITDAETILEPIPTFTFTTPASDSYFYDEQSSFLGFFSSVGKSSTYTINITESITLDFSFGFYSGGSSTNIDEGTFYVSFSNLKFDNNFSNIATSLTTEQKAIVDGVQSTTTSTTKDAALNSLKMSFLSSSLVTDNLNSAVKDLSSSYPALNSVNTTAITNSIASSFANSAISLVNGDGANIDTTFVNTMATEITASSINSGLSSLGVDMAISTECTSKLLGELAEFLGVDEVMEDATKAVNEALDDVMETISDGLKELKEYIPFDVSSAMSTGVLSDLNESYGKLLSSDCIKAVNNNFDIVDSQIATAAGAVSDYVTAKSTTQDATTSVAKQYISL